jgi:hypothetical protein
MKKYEIIWNTYDLAAIEDKTSIGGEIKNKEELIRHINSIYGEKGWALISAAQSGNKVTLFFQRMA